MVTYNNFSYKFFIEAYMLRQETWIFTILSEGPLRLVAFYDKLEKICSNLTRIHIIRIVHFFEKKNQKLTQTKDKQFFCSFMASLFFIYLFIFCFLFLVLI